MTDPTDTPHLSNLHRLRAMETGHAILWALMSAIGVYLTMLATSLWLVCATVIFAAWAGLQALDQALYVRGINRQIRIAGARPGRVWWQ